MPLARFQLNAILRAALAAATAATIPTVAGLGYLGTGIGSASDFTFGYLHNNALLDSRGFTALNSGGPSVPTLDPSTGLPTTSSTLVFNTPPDSSSPGPLPPGNYYLNVYSVGQTVTASVYAAASFTLGTGVPQGDGVCIRYPLTVLPTTSAASQALNFSGPMSQMPDLARDGSVTAVGQPMFCNDALSFYSALPCLRLLDFLATNGRVDTTWSTRPGNWPMRAYGQPYSWEKTVAFLNALAGYPGSRTKNVFINIPGNADNTYVSSLATYLTTLGLTSSIQLYVQRTNEHWNTAFASYGTYLTSAMAETKYVSNYGIGSPIITSIVTNGTTATFTLSAPVSNYISGSSAPCCVVGGAGGFSVGTYAAPTTATVTGTYTLTVPTGATFTTGNVGIIFNLASGLITDGVLPDVYHIGFKWFTRLSYQDQQVWSAIRPQDRFYIDVAPVYGAQGPNGSGPSNTPIEFAYAAYLGGGSASWCYGAAVGFYVQSTSASTTLTALFAQLNSLVTGAMDGFVRNHVYLCKLNGWHPMAYEGGPDLQNTPSLMISAMTDARMGAVVTALLNTWYSNGGEHFNYYHGTPAAFSNASQGGWSALQSYADITSPKYAALTAYGPSAITLANVNGSGAGTVSLTAYYQNTTRQVVVNGLLGWFETGHTVDFEIAFPSSGSYTLTLVGCAQVANSIALYLEPSLTSNGTSLGASTIPASGSGWNVGTSADALPVADPVTVVLAAGIHTIRLIPTTCGSHGTGLTQLIIVKN